MLQQYAWQYVQNALIILTASTAAVILRRLGILRVVFKPKETNENEANLSEVPENSTVDLPSSDDSSLKRENVVGASIFDKSFFSEIVTVFLVLSIGLALFNFINYIQR